jgi:hypothetical protein
MKNSENNSELKIRVLTCRSKLEKIGVKMPRHFFCKKYPEFINDENRLNNLWYAKISNKDFTTKLEAFTTFKEVEFN